MSEMKHTPEPWRTGRGTVLSDTEEGLTINGTTGEDVLKYYGGYLVGESINEANAHRIVQCVNACEGMTDPAAEIAAMKAEIERLRTMLPTEATAPDTKPDLRRKFIPCTKEEVAEVCDMLASLGLRADAFSFPRHWADDYTGVKTYFDNTYQTYFNDDNYPEITIQQLRDLAAKYGKR